MYRLKNSGFKLFITGVQNVGKTMISKRLQTILKNNDALQIIEVDFLKDFFHKDILMLKKKANEHGMKLNELRWILEDMSLHQTISGTSYILDFDGIEKQSEYLFPRLMHAVERHTEKGIPTIIEGQNIPVDKLIKYYREKKINDLNFDLNSIIIVNLYVNSIEDLEKHLNFRIIDRQLAGKEKEKQETEILDLWKLNEYLKASVEKLKEKNQDMNIAVIDNSGIEDMDVAVRPIINLIEKTNNFR